LAVSTSLFNTNYSQNRNTFQVKKNLDHQYLIIKSIGKSLKTMSTLQIFLKNQEPTSSDISEEEHSNQKGIHDQNVIVLPKNYVSLESLFTRDDQTKTMDTTEESSFRKVQET
jgi:hypothetical protein